MGKSWCIGCCSKSKMLLIDQGLVPNIHSIGYFSLKQLLPRLSEHSNCVYHYVQKHFKITVILTILIRFYFVVTFFAISEFTHTMYINSIRNN